MSAASRSLVQVRFLDPGPRGSSEPCSLTISCSLPLVARWIERRRAKPQRAGSIPAERTVLVRNQLARRRALRQEFSFVEVCPLVASQATHRDFAQKRNTGF